MIIGNEQNGGPKVYAVSEYNEDHPGGVDPLMKHAGGDADEGFEENQHSNDARKELKKYCIGKLDASAEESFAEERASRQVATNAQKK